MKCTITLHREINVYEQYCKSDWKLNVAECPEYVDEIQSDESTEPSCNLFGYLDEDTRMAELKLGGTLVKRFEQQRPLRAKACVEAVAGCDRGSPIGRREKDNG